MSWLSDRWNESMSGWSNAITDIKNAGGHMTDQQMSEFNAQQAQLARQFNAEQAQLARDFNSAEAFKQREFEERMANTQYQRAVADLKAAGLNSALAYSQGGASVPSVSAASAGSASGGSASAGRGSDSPLLGALFGLLRTAISANSALSVASLNNNGAMSRAVLSANSARELQELRDSKSTISDFVPGIKGRSRRITWKE